MFHTDKEVILVDFFDTIMFRKIHPFKIYERWAFLISVWMGCPELQTNILHLRNQAIIFFDQCKKEISWKLIYDYIFDNLKDEVKSKITKDDFVSFAHKVEIDVEIGVQYPHKRLLKKLQGYKDKGLRIYIVSDFHLDADDLKLFLKAKNIDVNSIFDGIFVSSDYGTSKAQGGLYKMILDILKVNPVHVLMIGDNDKSDGINAISFGISSKIEHNYIEKGVYQLRRFLGFDYTKHAFKSIEKTSRRFNSAYSEYSLIFYVFSKLLYERLLRKHANHIVFLSREGHFLKRSFDAMREITPPNNQIISYYFMCSRRASQSTSVEKLKRLVNEKISLRDYLFACGFDNIQIEDIAQKYKLTRDSLDNGQNILSYNGDYLRLMAKEKFATMLFNKIETNKMAFKDYIQSFKKEEEMNIVDIGWRGGMQDAVGDAGNCKTTGYYLGLINSIYSIENKNGLIFTYCPKNDKVSPYSEILRSNTQLYEQLTAAPHGSAIGYIYDSEGRVRVLTDWAENEKMLYEQYIKKKQDELLLIQRGLSAWCDDLEKNKVIRSCAKLVLRSALFANKDRLSFLKRLDEGFIWNFNSQSRGLKYDKKNVNISFDIFIKPEKYTRYFAKIQRSITSPVLNALYRPFATLFFLLYMVFCQIKK